MLCDGDPKYPTDPFIPVLMDWPWEGCLRPRARVWSRRQPDVLSLSWGLSASAITSDLEFAETYCRFSHRWDSLYHLIPRFTFSRLLNAWRKKMDQLLCVMDYFSSCVCVGGWVGLSGSRLMGPCMMGRVDWRPVGLWIWQPFSCPLCGIKIPHHSSCGAMPGFVPYATTWGRKIDGGNK